MFETASRSGSNSSESIVNISRSGASSISSPATTTSTNKDKQIQEIDRLCEEKKNLESRIRGYQALRDLVVDYRKENAQLKRQLNLLKSQQHTMSGLGDDSTANNPFSLVSSQAAGQSSGTLPQPDMSKATQEKMVILHPEKVSGNSESGVTSVAYPPVMGPPSSLQETEGPSDYHQTKLVSLSAVSGTSIKPATSQQESTVKEETTDEKPLTSEISSSGVHKSDQPKSLTSEASAPEVLQPDSDKYDESTYEKVGMQLGAGHAGLTHSMYAAGNDRAESRPIDFPSLSSGTSAGMGQPASHSSTSNPPFMVNGSFSKPGQGNVTRMQKNKSAWKDSIVKLF